MNITSDGQEQFKEYIMGYPNLEDVIKGVVKVDLTEDQIRDMVGAPTREEEEYCMCGKKIVNCKESYEHMTHGV